MDPHDASWPPGATFRPLLTASLNGFAVLDKRGRYLFTSPSMSNLFGFRKEEMQGCAKPEARPALPRRL